MSWVSEEDDDNDDDAKYGIEEDDSGDKVDYDIS